MDLAIGPKIFWHVEHLLLFFKVKLRIGEAGAASF